ncbi:MAG: TetR family transcriptional regulator C-terminal domain-containing protein [Tunicatimonas sp.]
MAETTAKKSAKAPVDTSTKIKEAYLDHLLEHGEPPPSVYQFTKRLKMKEAAFYEHYNSFTSLERDIWRGFFDQALTQIQGDEVYREYSVREKLLAFYYTWIEVLKNNRSYVTFRVQHMGLGNTTRPGMMRARAGAGRMNADVLSRFKEGFLDFANELLMEGRETEEVVDRPLISSNYDEGLWRQVLFVLNFWVNDDSQNFERTDVAIEKAVNLSFDLFGRSALDSAVDFARFLYQRR